MVRVDPDNQKEPIDYDVLQGVLSEYPVRLAIVFGSRVRGDAHATSDIDIAVEFEDSVYEQNYTETRLAVITDIMSALGENAVDVADLQDMKPAIGKAALEHGIIIIGTQERAAYHRERFGKWATDSTRSHLDRFDELLDDIEALV